MIMCTRYGGVKGSHNFRGVFSKRRKTLIWTGKVVSLSFRKQRDLGEGVGVDIKW